MRWRSCRAGLALRRAVRRQFGRADVVRVAAHPPARYGGPDRRWRRRAFRRLSALSAVWLAEEFDRLPSVFGGCWRDDTGSVPVGRAAEVGPLVSAICRNARAVFAPSLSGVDRDLRQARRDGTLQLRFRSPAADETPRPSLCRVAGATAATRTAFSLADLITYLPCDLMTKVDIASMAHGLECRQPFLDYRVVELAARMPRRLKFRRGQGKLVLRKAFADLLPRVDPASRPKMGFGVPLDHWFRHEMTRFHAGYRPRRQSARAGLFPA